jgi:hypothetical protein
MRASTGAFACGGERTRTADPLLAKHGAGDSVTSGFASSADHEHDSGEVETKFTHRSLTRAYTFGTRPIHGSGPRWVCKVRTRHP